MTYLISGLKKRRNGSQKLNYKWPINLLFLAIEEIQINTTLRFHLNLVIMAFIKKTNSKRWEGCRQKLTPHTLLVGT